MRPTRRASAGVDRRQEGIPAALRHPRLVLAITLVLAVFLGGLGIGVEQRLNPTSLSIPGTESARGGALFTRYFGNSTPFVILLQGPGPAIDRQGPGLVRALRSMPGVATLSPWDEGSVARLRPSPRKALILVDFHLGLGQAMRETVPRLDALLARRISSPVRATQSSFASVLKALQNEALSATERGELIAAPLLLIVLLVVFGSPIAAIVPLLFGAMTVMVGRGVLDLLASLTTIDGLSLIACTMFGLALGVDYSLLMVSRFRQEMAGGATPIDAAHRTRQTAGKTTVFAGSTLLLAILASAALQAGSLLVSLALALAVVTAISVAISWAVVPAALLILGDNVNRWRIGGRQAKRSRVMVVVDTALRRPAVAVVVVVPLLLLAAPALAFNTGAPGVNELPAANPARKNAELIDRSMGPGWDATYTVVAASEKGTIADPHRLAAIANWQQRVAAWPGVQAVIGPAAITRKVAPLRTFATNLLGPAGAKGKLASVRRLGPNLGRADRGVSALRRGLAAAISGSGLLGAGSGRAEAGANAISSGLAAVAGGGKRAVEATARLAAGSQRMNDAQRLARVATVELALELDGLLEIVNENGVNSAHQLSSDLNRQAGSQPKLGNDASLAHELLEHLIEARNNARALRTTAAQLHHGLSRLTVGGSRLSQGARRLAGAAGALTGGLGRLSFGSAQLGGGLSRLTGGIGALREGLSEGFHRSYPLQVGLAGAQRQVSGEARVLGRAASSLQRSSPHFFDSGYFVLSALAGAPPAQRRQINEAINLQRGGQAARILVVPTYPFNSAGSEALQRRLIASGERLGQQTGLEVGVTGGAATLNDYGQETRARLPLIIGAIVLAVFLALVFILRAPLLAGLVVALNLLSVGAAIGVVTLLLGVPAGYPLGGHSYVDTVGAAAIFGVTFGLSIDYAVFLLARMREGYERDGDNAAAVFYGLERTAGVITGAAAIMAAVFIVFATAQIATISQMGIGLTVAVVLDATAVRIILLPALMLLIGERVWWVPGFLDRALPHWGAEGERAGS